MAAKKRMTGADGKSADTYTRQAAAKSASLRATNKRYNRLEAALIDAGIPMSKAAAEAQRIMEKAMGKGRSTPIKGYGASPNRNKKK